jgi:serine/threonine protein kinase
MDIKTGSVLVDRYQIHKQLSKKSGRQTFLAQDLQSQDLVIIKILRFDPDFQWDDLKLFEREAATLKYLDHPSIPKYLDYFDVEESNTRGFALVQSYIEAPSLENIIKEGQKFSESEVIKLAEQLLLILNYLHNQLPPVIHRDIKPSNILLSNKSDHNVGDIYLVDFGSVQTSASKEDGTITIVGTYGYIPLEQFGGKTTAASDLYSLGMTIIYLLTGSHPFELPEVNGQVKFTAEINNQFRRWLEKMTQPYLDKRFDSATSAQVALISPNSNCSDFNHLKPKNSRIRLYRDQQRIEIHFNRLESKTLTLISLYGITFPVCLIYFIVFSGTALIGCLIGPPVFCFHYAFVKSICSKKVLAIDLQQKSISTGVYSELTEKVKWEKSRADLNFDGLVYIPGYSVHNPVNYHSNNEYKIGGISVLYLYWRSTKYYIGNAELSRNELRWLGQELSDFLGLELQTFH